MRLGISNPLSPPEGLPNVTDPVPSGSASIPTEHPGTVRQVSPPNRTDANGEPIKDGRYSVRTSLSRWFRPPPIDRSDTLNKNGFKQLPVETVQQILGELIRNRSSASEALRDLGSIQLTSRFLYDALSGEANLNGRYQTLKELRFNLGLIGVDTMLSPSTMLPDKLGLLTPEKRKRLFKAINGDKYAKRMTINEMGAKLANLPPKMRQKMVNMAIKEDRIAGLGAGMVHLEQKQREALFRATLKIKNEMNRGVAIGGLAAGWEHLEEAQREELIAAVLNMADNDNDNNYNKAYTIAAMAIGAEHLTLPQRQRLITATCSMASCWSKIVAIEGLGAKLELFSEAQRLELVMTALDSTNKTYTGGMAIAGLGVGVKYLKPEQRQQMITAAVNFPPGEHVHQAMALTGLIAGLEHLSEAQRQQLVTAAIALPRREKHTVFAQLAAEMKHLTEAQRHALVTDTLGIEEEWYKAGAISALAAGLENLSETQRQQLIDAAHQMVNKWGGESKAIAGLGAGLAHLSEGQRQQLIDAALQMNDPKATTQAIDGLAAGLAFLTPTQQQDLSQAILRLDNGPEKAVSIIKLANGWVSG